MRLEILTEEKSMEVFLRGLLPRILPTDVALDDNCFIHSHEGKSHLLKSIPKKMRAYPHFDDDVRVLIIHDQDSNDCMKLKKKISDLCSPNIRCMVRIACIELENWYLGDFDAIAKIFVDVKPEKLKRKAKYRFTDKLTGSEEMKHISKNRFTKIQTARDMSKIIDPENNTSQSFNHFIKGLKKLIHS